MHGLKLEHAAIASNTERESDLFFVELLGCKKARTFTVSKDLMEKFFQVACESEVIRYEKDKVNFEVFLTNDDAKTRDIFTHICLMIENRDEFFEKANQMGFNTVKVPREGSDSYYLFVRDFRGNLYEIKEI
ncbi:MAG: hypothetical protein JW891_02045 [Candidatus Lokiarchaeota archaeon]|nr:hypothetical protein [Candidatus Lokiarchaeota archaeon]